MRAAAEIEPVALEIDLDRLIAGDGVDQLDLEILALVAEHLLGLLAVPHLPGEGLSRAMISRIFFSIVAKSSGVNGSLRKKS